MQVQLRDGVHWCRSGDRAVFLDVEADRYFCLPATANEAFLRVASGDSRPQDLERTRMLVSQGILVQHSGSAAVRQPPLIEAPKRDLFDEPSASSSFLSICRQAVAEAVTARILRTRPFSQVIADTKRKCANPGRRPRNQQKNIEAIAAASSAVSFVLRAHNRCLVRALAVHSVCIRQGIRPKLVFGVIAHPFAAHCWVQLDDAVIVGGFEQARLYAPILVLE